MFFQISNDPWIGHSRLKAWLSYLLLLMLLLFICFMVLTHMFTQTAHAGIWDSVSRTVYTVAEGVSQLYEKTKGNFLQHDKEISSSCQHKQEKLGRKTRKKVNKRLGKEGLEAIDHTKTKYGPGVAKAVAEYPAHAKQGSLKRSTRKNT